jgi:integrase/recombinase XerC
LHDWQADGQELDAKKPATINRANASLRTFFAWAHTERLISHNPAADLHDLPTEDLAPRSIAPQAVDWLFRIASAQHDPTLRLRDLALLTLLDCGLRSQEAADLQFRDVDLDGGQLTVRTGKGRKARRIPIDGEPVRYLADYLAVRCPTGLPPLGSNAEREPFLMGQRVDRAGQPWQPGLQTAAMRKRLAEFGIAAAARVTAQAAKEPSLARVNELQDLARQLVAASPHRLRHGLAYRLLEGGATPAYVAKLLGHRRISTALLYGKPTETDLRLAMARAHRHGHPGDRQ